MPRFDLRQDEGTLDPLAIFKVLAVMCHPNDRIQREKMLGIIEKETGVARPRRHPVTAEAFMQEIPLTFRRAAVAGSLLLTMLQLHHSGRRASLNQAIPLVIPLLPEWQQPQSPYWSEICHFEHRPRSKTTMLQAYNQFRTVAHFWARAPAWSGARPARYLARVTGDASDVPFLRRGHSGTCLRPPLICERPPPRPYLVGGMVLHNPRADRAGHALGPAAN